MYYRQPSPDIKMKTYKIKTHYVSQRPLGSNKTGINIIIFLIFVKKWLKSNTLHEFLVWIKTGSNPDDINRY